MEQQTFQRQSKLANPVSHRRELQQLRHDGILEGLLLRCTPGEANAG
jgi:hypothetical protein